MSEQKHLIADDFKIFLRDLQLNVQEDILPVEILEVEDAIFHFNQMLEDSKRYDYTTSIYVYEEAISRFENLQKWSRN